MPLLLLLVGIPLAGWFMLDAFGHGGALLITLAALAVCIMAPRPAPGEDDEGDDEDPGRDG